MNAGADETLLDVTALFVGGVAFVAGAISFAHMREFAANVAVGGADPIGKVLAG